MQIRTTPLESGLPGPATLLFNHPVCGIMPIISILPIPSSNNNEHYEVLVTRQTRNNKNYVTSRNYDSFSIGSTVAVQWEDGGPQTHGTVVGRGDHNHSKHTKVTPITA